MRRGGSARAPTRGEKRQWKFKLYVAGQGPKSLRAFSNLKRICEEHLAGRHQIEIVDVSENPGVAIEDQVVALPTLIRQLPPPVRKIIGDLSNTQRVLIGLELESRGLEGA